MKPVISIIAAVDQNMAIGYKKTLLCHLPNDLRYFKQVTSGHPVIMGRRTYESLPVKPLPERLNIVVSKSNSVPPPGCVLAQSVEEALVICQQAEECFVIGGEQIYKQMMPVAQKIYLTRLHKKFEADAWFPDMTSSEWKLLSSEYNAADEKHLCDYSFEVYQRIKNKE